MTSAVDNHRTRDIHTALRRLGAARIENFLRTAGAAEAHTLAVRLVNQELDAGRDLATVLLGEHDDDGYLLEVKGRGRKFRIFFGCCPGPLAGDGGRWDVTFDTDGRVLSCEGREMWIS